ncbi:MAG: protein kinase [Verrucomicrobiae bacterium]|nr:protein kinase [Verrucomicrobiae bacterium]
MAESEPDEPPASAEPDYAKLFGAALSSESFGEVKGEERVGTLGGYALLAKIGEGGMGLVWRAREPETGRLVALKQLRFIDAAQDTKRSRESAARFRREIGLAARLEHPGIARVYDTGVDESGNLPFFTMELVDGEPLHADGKSEADILTLAIRCCDAVEYAHRNGVIHRDLKPGNILVTRDGEVKVLDFGVARALEESAIGADLSGGDLAATLSRDGEILGTPAFMAPEQARGESFACDTRTDVFALGAILFRLLTGHLPHSQEGGDWAVLRRVAEGEVRRPVEVRAKKMAPDLEAILMKALSFAPNDRYDSAGELGRDLQRYLAGDPVTAQALTASYWLKKHIRRHRGRWLAGAAAFLGLLTLSGFWLNQRGQFLAEQVELRTQAEANEKAARDSEVRSLVRVARVRSDSGARGEALAYLARAVRLDPDYREARAALMVAMKQFPSLYRESPTLRFEGPARMTAFSPDGRWFALGVHGKKGGVRIFDGETLEERAVVEGNFSAKDLQISPKGGCVAALFDYFQNGDERITSCLILAGPDGVLHREEFDHGTSTLAFSRDGKWLAVTGDVSGETGEAIGGAMIYRVSDPSEPILIHPFRELNRPGFPDVVFSADGRFLYFRKQEADGRIHRWNLESGELLRTGIRAAPEGWRPLFIQTMVVHPDGDLFVAGQGDFVSRWRDQESGPARIWSDRVEGAIAIAELALSADNRYLAGAATDSRVFVWDAETGERLVTLPHGERVLRVWFCPGRPELLATLSGAESVTLWNWRTGQPVAEPLEGGEPIYSIAFSPDGARLLVGRAGHVRLWSTTPRRWEPKVVECEAPIDGIAFTGHGTQMIATSHQSGQVFLIEGMSGQTIHSWPHRSLYSHDREPQHHFDAHVNRLGRYVVTADSPRVLQVRPVPPDSQSAPFRIELSADATAVTTTENGRFLAVGDENHETRVFDLRPEEGDAPVEVCMLKGEGLPKWEIEDWRRRYPDKEGKLDNFVSHLAFSPNTFRLVMTEFPLSAVTAWDWRQSRRIGAQPMVVENTIVDLQITKDNGTALFGGHSADTQEMNLTTGNKSGPTRRHGSSVTCLRMDRESKRLVSASVDGEIRFWNLQDPRQRPTGSAHPSDSPVLSMAMDQETVVCATGNREGEIRLWLVASGQPFCDPLDAGAAVLDLAFHHRLPLLAAACADGKVRIWEIPTGQARPPRILPSIAESLAGLYLGDDGRVKPGAVFYFDPKQRELRPIYEADIQRRRENPDYQPSEYHRLLYDIFRFPEIPEPAWLLPEQ